MAIVEQLFPLVFVDHIALVELKQALRETEQTIRVAKKHRFLSIHTLLASVFILTEYKHKKNET